MSRFGETHIPKLQHHRAANRAFVRLNGVNHYLGRWGDPTVEPRYSATIRRWLDGGRQPLGEERQPMTVAELLVEFWGHAEAHYRKNGKPTSEQHNFRAAIRPPRRLYGEFPVGDFGPKALATVRQEMVELGWARKSVNQNVSRIRTVFRWGVSQELVPVEVLQALEALQGLQQGRCSSPISIQAYSFELIGAPSLPDSADLYSATSRPFPAPGRTFPLRSDRAFPSRYDAKRSPA